MGLVALLALAGCSNGDERVTAANDRGSTTTTPNTYNNEVDGVSIAWPEGWHRAEEPLGGPGRTPHVELFALATFEGATAGQCAPDPDAAMAALEEDDALFVLRTSEDYGEPGVQGRPARPADLMAAAERHPDSVNESGEPAVEGSCFPEGVEAWRVLFQEHGRPYEAFVAARAPLGDQRRSELQQIWSKLELRPIETGLEDAAIGHPYWHILYTHCGIKGTRFDGREWVADPQLSDGQGNPPRGWGNPDEHGTILLKDEDTAVFESRYSDRSATFRPRTPEDGPAPMCQ